MRGCHAGCSPRVNSNVSSRYERAHASRIRTPSPNPTSPTINQPPASRPSAASAPGRKTLIGGVLMDSCLSRWLLALAHSNVSSRPERLTASRHRTPSANSKPPRNSNVPQLRFVCLSPKVRSAGCGQLALATPEGTPASLAGCALATPPSPHFCSPGENISSLCSKCILTCR
jgi:hypothetical protein